MKKSIFTLGAMLLFLLQIHAQFTSNPAANTVLSDASGEQALSKIAICSNGNMYISWFSNESGNYNVRMQYLDMNGNALWEPNGILISDEDQMTWLTDYDLTVDGENYAILTFQDIRMVDNNPVGYRVSPTGEMMWGEEGVLLSNNANFEPAPKVCVTTSGNSIFAWQSSGDENEVHLQKVSPDGTILWGDGIALAESGIQYTSPYLQPAEGDYAFLIWHKETGPFWAADRGLYVQKLDTDGSFIWAETVEIYAPIGSGPVVSLEMCRDNDGGIVFSWYGNDVGTHFNCWVQHMNADGSLTMTANGVVVATTQSQNHMYTAPSFLPETEEIVVFFSEQDLNQNQRGLYAQKFDMQGVRQWTDNGKELIALSNNDYSLPSANGYMDKAICIYGAYESGNVVDENVQAVLLDSDGDFVWDDEFIDMSTVQSDKLHRVISDYSSGQWVAVWEDGRDGDMNIYAQNIHVDGSLGIVAGEPGKILGFVRDAVSNLSIDNATIYATNADDGYQTIETPFGSHYSFMVNPGTYNLSCEAAGYETAEAMGVVVMEYQNTAYNFYLTPTDNITGVQSVNAGQAYVSPNPFVGELNFSMENTENTTYKIQILDTKGQVLRRANFTSDIKSDTYTIDLSDLRSGVYFYRIETLNKNYSGKIIKQ